MSRPRLPPSASGLPVITSGVRARLIVEYSSTIQPITIALVYMSGAGMSTSGPIASAIWSMYWRDSRSSSASDSSLVSTVIPPLAPPKGRSRQAHLNVIQKASDCTSSTFTRGWKRMPPLVGPRVAS